jgi:hypothetical protein
VRASSTGAADGGSYARPEEQGVLWPTILWGGRIDSGHRVVSLLEKGRATGRPNGDSAAQPGRRALGRRLSRAQWLALALGVLAALVNLAALRDRRETVSVAVADEPIAQVSRVTRDMVRFVDVPADSPVAARLLDESSLAEGGMVSTRGVAEGEPLTASAVAGEVPQDGLRSMSVPVASQHAVGGALRPGDRVDVLDAVDGEAVWVVVDAEVLAVGGESAAAVSAPEDRFEVTLAVDASGAQRLAAALADERVEVVRSTGAAPIDVQSAGPLDEGGEAVGGPGTIGTGGG